MTPPGHGRRVVIGVGNEYRRDDGFGPTVVARLAALRESDPGLASVGLAVSDGEPTRLLDLWTGADLAVVVDAVRAPDGAGGRRYEVALDELGQFAEARAASSHGLSLGSAVALGRALDRLPRRLVALAVAGREFGFGTDLTPEVAVAVDPVVTRVREVLAAPS
jgi:hydrogenase maturation protease